MDWPPITLADVLDARRRIAPHLRPTPLYAYAGLDRLVGAEVLVKHENHQPVGAFKVRGGVNLVSRLDDGERRSKAAIPQDASPETLSDYAVEACLEVSAEWGLPSHPVLLDGCEVDTLTTVQRLRAAGVPVLVLVYPRRRQAVVHRHGHVEVLGAGALDREAAPVEEAIPLERDL